MLSEVRRKQPFHGNVGTCERPLHGRHGAAPRLSGRVCAGICRGDPRVGLRGAACSGLAWAAAAKAPAVADPPTSRPAGPTQDGRSPRGLRTGRAGPARLCRSSLAREPTSWGYTGSARSPTCSFSPTRLHFYVAAPHPAGFPGLG